MRNKVKLAMGALFFTTALMAQTGSVSSVLQNQTTEVKSVGKTIANWVFIILGVVALVQAVLIFTSSQGSGEEKMKKAGNYIFMLVFVAVAYVITQALFPS